MSCIVAIALYVLINLFNQHNSPMRLSPFYKRSKGRSSDLHGLTQLVFGGTKM